MFVNPRARYFNAFNLIDGMGPIAFKKLLAHFGSIKNAWSAEPNEFKLAGLSESLIKQIKIKRPKINPDIEIEKLDNYGISLVTIEDENYPKPLKEIYNPPATLYLRGQFKPTDDFSLAVVGSRTPSFYGQQITPQITNELSQAGLTIVSGLAKGIDTFAHNSALLANGRTIAVLGSGIDKKSIYPPSNQYLAERISENGALISEFPLGSPAKPQHFPQRNRIISGLSLGVLVIEASIKSGSLITAKDGLEQNRDIFAVPGSILSQTSSGTNNLIKMGAKLVSKADDILQELNINPLTAISKPPKRQRIYPDNPKEAIILKQLSVHPTHIDKIITHSRLPANIINSTLTLMEIKGKIKNIGGGNYILAR